MAIVTQPAELPKASAVEPIAPAPVEAPAEAPKAPEDQMSSKFAALAKKEKWIKKMMDDVNRQKKEIESKESEYKSNYVPKSRIKEQFMDVITEAGMTPDQVANILLNQPQGQVDPAFAEMKAEIKALREELTATKTSSESKEKTQYDQAVAQVKSDAEALLSGDSENVYETLKTKSNAADLVTSFIEETYKEEGRVLKVEDAATFIENELLEQAIAMAGLKKVQSKLGLVAAPKEEPQKQQLGGKQPMKTLTQAMSPTSNKLTWKDRRARAIAAAQGLDPDSVR